MRKNNSLITRRRKKEKDVRREYKTCIFNIVKNEYKKTGFVFWGVGFFFAGDKLLTNPNPEFNEYKEMFKILGLASKEAFADGE